jgi:predicted TIM-barrel fold metal-dependent hydrolase
MLSRRHFLAGTAAAGATFATGLHSAQAQKRQIVDAQVHLWKESSPDYPWIEGSKPQLPEPFTYQRALKLMDEAGVDRVVVVPPGLSWSNNYALEAAKAHPTRFAVMGRMQFDNPKGPELIAKWKSQPGMLGVRHNVNDATSMSQIKDGTANWFWAAAEKAGIPVMYFAAGQAAVLAPIAEKHPGLTLIIDHLGINSAVAKKKAIPEAIAQVVSMAKYPNVGVKMSNLPGSSLDPYPYADLNEPLKRVFDAFGPQRCYWGTDVTNGLKQADWKQRRSHVENLAFLSEQDKDWVMGRAILQRLKWA